MGTRWLSINDVKRLVKQNLYRLETGSKSGDSLIYDRQSRRYVGHIESNSNSFHQDPSYDVPYYVVEYLETFRGEDW